MRGLEGRTPQTQPSPGRAGDPSRTRFERRRRGTKPGPAPPVSPPVASILDQPARVSPAKASIEGAWPCLPRRRLTSPCKHEKGEHDTRPAAKSPEHAEEAEQPAPEPVPGAFVLLLVVATSLMVPPLNAAPEPQAPGLYDPVADPHAVVTLGHARFTVLTSQLVRMEWSADGKFEDHASLVFLNRKLPVPHFTAASSHTTTGNSC